MDTPHAAGLSMALSLIIASPTFAQSGKELVEPIGAVGSRSPGVNTPDQVGLNQNASRSGRLAVKALSTERRHRWPEARGARKRRICNGCGAEPNETSSISDIGDAAEALERKRDTQLNELQAAAKTQPQSDLDTVKLALAHREQATSVEEKTNGLWQSWLVSICDGCGDQKPSRSLGIEAWPERKVSHTLRDGGEAQKSKLRRHAAVPRAYSQQASVLSDLSPGRISTIRKMPKF